MSNQVVSTLAGLEVPGGIRTAKNRPKTLYVSSVYGANGNDGSIDNPLATAVKAHALLADTAINPRNNGDTIVCLPGHAETLASAGALTLSRSGVKLKGVGSGALVPTFTCATSTAATLLVSGANVQIDNIKVVVGVDALVTALSITGADCSISNLVTSDNNSNYNVLDMITTSAAATRLSIDGWKHLGASGATGAQSAITIVGGDNITIDNFDLDGDFAVAAIENVTTAATNLKIGLKSVNKNHIRTRNAADIAITLVSTATGYIDNVLIRLTDDAANVTECVAPGDANVGREVIVANADSEQGMIINTTASTDET